MLEWKQRGLERAKAYVKNWTEEVGDKLGAFLNRVGQALEEYVAPALEFPNPIWRLAVAGPELDKRIFVPKDEDELERLFRLRGSHKKRRPATKGSTQKQKEGGMSDTNANSRPEVAPTPEPKPKRKRKWGLFGFLALGFAAAVAYYAATHGGELMSQRAPVLSGGADNRPAVTELAPAGVVMDPTATPTSTLTPTPFHPEASPTVAVQSEAAATGQPQTGMPEATSEEVPPAPTSEDIAAQQGQEGKPTPEPTPTLSSELAELQKLLTLEEPVEGTATIRAFHRKSGVEAQEEVALHTVFDLLSMYEQVTGKQGVVDTVRSLLEQGKIALIWWNEEAYSYFPDMMGALRVYDAAILIINENGDIKVKPLNEGGAGILAEYGHWAVQSEYGRKRAFRGNADYLDGLPERIGSPNIEKPSHNRLVVIDISNRNVLTGIDLTSQYIWVSSRTSESALIKYNAVFRPLSQKVIQDFAGEWITDISELASRK